MSQRFAGSSFTNGLPGYRGLVQAWELLHKPGYTFTFSNQAIGGHNTWSNLIRLVTGDDLFIIDTANDTDSIKDKNSLEVLIRRLWASNPNTRILIVSSPSWGGMDINIDDNVHHPVIEAMLINVEALAAHYGIPIVDYWGWCESVVDAGIYHLNELTIDKVHPSDLGYANMATLVEAFLPAGGQSQPALLPDRLYDSASYENTPTRIVGTNYDSRTGTGWTDAGTRTSSSTAGDTITYSATCQTIGIYYINAPPDAANCEISVDGGVYRNAALYQYGIVLIEGLGAHSITIRLKAGGSIVIDEFWAI